ncbi:MAG TPA: PEGA domain-containing protein [Mesoaciditoga lauensis]|nr:PEGA domain-containing protein [Mesoaciditoga lauensis]
MKRTFFFSFAVIILLAVLVYARASVQDIIITPTQPSSLTINVWTDKPAGATFYPGDNIHIYFKTSQNAYVTIYDYTTDGNVRVIFPNFFQRDNFVKGGMVYVIPNPNYNYNLTVSGPNGREIIEAVASTTPIVQPPLPSNKAFGEITDGPNYFQKLKLEITGKDVAVGVTYFYVGFVPLTGIVHFESQPSGAKVYVDGIYEGLAPLDLQLAEGEHFAVFWYDNVSVSKSFYVNPNTYNTVKAYLYPQQSYNFSVNFNTSPPGAMIFVNGRMLGISPCVVSLAGGTYQITIVKPDYSTIVTQISVNQNQNFNFNLYRLSF